MKVPGICENCGQKQKFEIKEDDIHIQDLSGDQYLGFRALRWLFYVVICLIIFGYGNCMVEKHYDYERIHTLIKDPDVRVRHYEGSRGNGSYWEFYNVKTEKRIK